MAGDQVDREEEKKSEKGAGRQHHSGPAKPVAEIAPERLGLRGSWSVRHRGNYLLLLSQPRDHHCQECAGSLPDCATVRAKICAAIFLRNERRPPTLSHPRQIAWL